MKKTLAKLCALLIDLDGVLWVGQQPLPGVHAFFQFLRARDLRFILVSNNSTRRAAYTVERMQRMGVDIAPADVLTTAEATPRWLRAHAPQLQRVLVIGETALRDALTQAQFEIVERDADAVIVGLDRQVNYEKLKRATLELRRGARFIATNTDRTLPTEEGLTPGAGALVAALVAATDLEPLVIGKPGRPLFELALDLAKTPIQETAMLGDRLDTDIDGAAALGLTTIMVLTGVSTRAQAAQNKHQPDFIFENLDALRQAWAIA
ncbi:MAG: acid sugar phosphatase [Chloroflexota bacterium]|nr:MAG: acid sugar phosphatase [Chloroflexota bacterium]